MKTTRLFALTALLASSTALVGCAHDGSTGSATTTQPAATATSATTSSSTDAQDPASASASDTATADASASDPSSPADPSSADASSSDASTDASPTDGPSTDSSSNGSPSASGSAGAGASSEVQVNLAREAMDKALDAMMPESHTEFVTATWSKPLKTSATLPTGDRIVVALRCRTATNITVSLRDPKGYLIAPRTGYCGPDATWVVKTDLKPARALTDGTIELRTQSPTTWYMALGARVPS